MNIGQILRGARKEVDLMQEDMAHLINISHNNISKLKRNEMSLQIEDFIRWMQVVQSKLSNGMVLYVTYRLKPEELKKGREICKGIQEIILYRLCF